MKLYLPYFEYDYEGEKILGVFDTEEKALKCLDIVNEGRTERYGDSEGVMKFTLNEGFHPYKDDEIKL